MHAICFEIRLKSRPSSSGPAPGTRQGPNPRQRRKACLPIAHVSRIQASRHSRAAHPDAPQSQTPRKSGRSWWWTLRSSGSGRDDRRNTNDPFYPIARGKSCTSRTAGPSGGPLCLGPATSQWRLQCEPCDTAAEAPNRGLSPVRKRLPCSWRVGPPCERKERSRLVSRLSSYSSACINGCRSLWDLASVYGSMGRCKASARCCDV